MISKGKFTILLLKYLWHLQFLFPLNIPVIASGGIHNIENVKKLAAESGSGIVGAITGRAIYEGGLDFAEGQKVADELSGVGSFGLQQAFLQKSICLLPKELFRVSM